MREELQKKVDRAIRLIKSAAGGQIEVSFSGGKDSDVILELVRMSGVNYRAIYKNTTIDPPGTIAHCKAKGVEIMPPTITFFDLIKKKGYPTRRARFCCEKLKEYKVMDMAVQGIRRCESTARSKRYSEGDPIICRIYGSKKNHCSIVLPILSWTDENVAEFIAERKIQCHPLYYDEKGNFHPERRLGCMACPLAPKKAIEDFKRYPKLLKRWIDCGKIWWESHPNTSSRENFADVYELMVHNLFYRSYAEFRNAVDGGLLGEKVDCKRFLEDYFNIEL